jgi:hypothetical protein
MSHAAATKLPRSGLLQDYAAIWWLQRVTSSLKLAAACD